MADRNADLFLYVYSAKRYGGELQCFRFRVGHGHVLGQLACRQIGSASPTGFYQRRAKAEIAD